MLSRLRRFIRVAAPSRSLVTGAVLGAAIVLAGGWALAGFTGLHPQATRSASLSSARLTTPSQAGTNVTENGTGPQGSQSLQGTRGSAGSNLAPDALEKHPPKRPDPGHHTSSKTTCPSGGVPTPGSTISGGLVVDGDCIITGIMVNGGIVIEGNGHLTLYASTVNGGTHVQRNGEFDSDNPPRAGGGNHLNGGVDEDQAFDMDIFFSAVQGGIHYSGGPLGAGFFYETCGTTVQGDVTLENIDQAGTEIGDSSASCPRNTITGNVHIRNTGSTSVELEFATIGGSVDIWNSHPAVTGNIIGGSLLCHQGATLGHYDADDSAPNTVHGTNTCA